MALPRVSTSFSQKSQNGFALVVALSLMAFVLLLLLSITTFVRVESQGSDVALKQIEAEQSALLGLMLAMGDLQKAAGHDQRITATADIVLPDSANDNRRNWVGVWDSSIYDPSSFNLSNSNENKTFIKWLVSNQDETSLQQKDAAAVVVDTPFVIFDGTHEGNRESFDVEVDEIGVQDASGRIAQTYAYWVEDNGLKADISWNETTETDVEAKQAARLGSAPGLDLRVFQDSSEPYNLADSETLDETLPFLQNLNKALNVGMLPLLGGGTGEYSDWLKRYRHDISSGSKAVLSDSKLGGLQRDLSLAFEMDGDEEAENATKFNQQAGEFVSSISNNQRLDSPVRLGGLPVKGRYLHRDTQSSGGPFSGDIRLSNSVMRGPTWWAIRDYANLYKQLSGSAGNYSLEARAYYPNEAQNERLSPKLTIFDRDSALFHLEVDTHASHSETSDYIQRPAKSNYAPVSLGGTTLVSLKAEDTELVLALDMLFYLWNPYNHQISCDNLVMRMDRALPGAIYIWKNNVKYATSLHEVMEDSLTSRDFSFLIKSETGGKIVLEPGEVVIATPSSTAGEANLGFTVSSDSGIILRNLDNGNPITAAATDAIGFRYAQALGTNAGVTLGGMRNEYELYLPDRELSLSDISSFSNFGSELQHLNFPTHALQDKGGVPGNLDPQEYLSPETTSNSSNRDNPVGATVNFEDIGTSKIFFGLLSSLTKPASWEGENPNPVEVFTRFNPNPIVVKREFNRVCALNQLYNMLCSDNPDELLLQNGIEYSVLARNAFWGSSFTTSGSEYVPLSSIPSSPLQSLAALSHANVSIMATEPFHPIANSWSSPLVPVDSIYGTVHDRSVDSDATAHDLSWALNDALFDRYFFSGIAPYYNITGTGYSLESGASIGRTLEDFYGDDYRDARAAPAIHPYVPDDESADDIVQRLDPGAPSNSASDGYSKLAAYAMLDGAFNVNSTSEKAWESLLRSNKNLDVIYSDGTTENGIGTPFPSSLFPANDSIAPSGWSGFASLDDDQIESLAVEIVSLVKARGPFMGLSDFVNRQIGTHEGVIQAAIQNSNINGTTASNGGGTESIYQGIADGSMNYFRYDQGDEARNSASGLPQEINQADVLLPLAPRMRPRSDTFTIRAYGRALSPVGETSSDAYCEAVVQRIPEYVDETLNEPWDEPMSDPHNFTGRIRPENSGILEGANVTFGRQFKLVSFRWLSEDEI